MRVIRMLFLAVLVVFGVIVVSQSDAHAQGAPIFAILYGGNETATADGNGWGAASIVLRSTTQLCYSIIVTAIGTPTGAHIHRGAAGVAGPIIVALDPPVGGNPGTVTGCETVTSAIGAEIRNFPFRFYINVHNATFPGGAVRGQLF